MATDIAIANLPTLAAASIQGDDILPIVDVSDTTDPGGTTKGITVSALGSTNVPKNGRTVTDLPTYLANNAVFNPDDYGISGDVDDTASINRAITAAQTNAGGVVLLKGGKTYAISSTGTTAALTIPNGVSFIQEQGAILSYTGFGQAVVCYCMINGHAIIEVVRSSIQWRDLATDTTSEGVRIVNDRCSSITVRSASGFVKNVNVYGDSALPNTGTYGTIITLGVLWSGFNQLTATAVNAGFANSVNIIGGVLAYVSADVPGGVPIVGTRFIGLGTTGNGWAFYGTDVEGTHPEVNIELAGPNNTFHGCRYENVRKVHCLSTAWATAFIGGYGGRANFDGTVWVDDSNKSSIVSLGPVAGSTQNAYGTYNDGLNQPAYTARCSTGDGGVLYEGHDSTQAMSFQILGNGTVQGFPAAGSTFPTMTFSFRTGVLSIGDGTGAPSAVWSVAIPSKFLITLPLQANTTFGCNGKTAQSAFASGGAVATTGSTQTTPYGFTTSTQADGIVTLLNNIRAALVANGIMS